MFLIHDLLFDCLSLSLCRIMKGFPRTLVEGWHKGHGKYLHADLDKEADPGLKKKKAFPLTLKFKV